MIAKNENSQCELAEKYYYDMLDPDTVNRVPENILAHVANCLHCVKKLAQLYELLSDSAHCNQEESAYIRQIPTQLARHFSLLGVRVNCQTVKEFLPLLADPDLEIKIPTPVTAHLDQCPQCSQDFETLRSLKLNSKQLATLAKFYSQSSFQSSSECSGVGKSIKAVAEMRFDRVTADTLKHIYLCKNCRNLLYSARLTMSEKVPESEKPDGFPCEAVGAADLFVYCLPYDLDPANDQYAKFRESLTGHLRKCPKCLEKMRQLHNTLYVIAERGESGVVTCYEIDSPAEKPEISDVDNLYADWPIKVQVLNKSRPAPDIIAFPRRLRQRVSALKLKQFIKPVAAAAVILIALALFFSIPAAKAMNLGQIYEALEKVKNVCISSFVPGKTEPIRKEWVSRGLNIRLQKTQEQVVLFDLQNRIRKIKDSSTDSVQTTSIAGDFLVKVESFIAGSFGLMPFSDIIKVLEDAQWNHVDDKNIETAVPDTEVYDLIWIEKEQWFRKWRVFVDLATNLPKRTEWFWKSTPEGEYILESIKVVTYPTDSEIEALIQSTFD